MNVQLAGRIYRCKDCGFSELWSTKSDRRQMTGRIVAFMIILAAIWGAFALYILWRYQNTKIKLFEDGIFMGNKVIDRKKTVVLLPTTR